VVGCTEGGEAEAPPRDRLTERLDNGNEATILQSVGVSADKGGLMAGCGCGKKPAAKKPSKPTDKKK